MVTNLPSTLSNMGRCMGKAIIYSFFVGFVSSSPLGPIGLICLRRTLTRGRSAGLVSACGIACAYAFWSFIAIYGLTAVSNWIEEERNLLEVAIAFFFFLYGLHGVFNTPSTYYPTLKYSRKRTRFLSTFLVVFLNPSTFVMFAILFTLFGISGTHYSFSDSAKISVSVFIGSIMFWVVLTQFIHKLRSRLSESTCVSISCLSSYTIMFFGIMILCHCFYENFFGRPELPF